MVSLKCCVFWVRDVLGNVHAFLVRGCRCRTEGWAERSRGVAAGTRSWAIGVIQGRWAGGGVGGRFLSLRGTGVRQRMITW